MVLGKKARESHSCSCPPHRFLPLYPNASAPYKLDGLQPNSTLSTSRFPSHLYTSTTRTVIPRLHKNGRPDPTSNPARLVNSLRSRKRPRNRPPVDYPAIWLWSVEPNISPRFLEHGSEIRPAEETPRKTPQQDSTPGRA